MALYMAGVTVVASNRSTSLEVMKAYKQPWKHFYTAYIQILLASLSLSYKLQQSERF